MGKAELSEDALVDDVVVWVRRDSVLNAKEEDAKCATFSEVMLDVLNVDLCDEVGVLLIEESAPCRGRLLNVVEGDGEE